jgi:hypothetical protein
MMAISHVFWLIAKKQFGKKHFFITFIIRRMKAFGIILIVAGILMLIFRSFSFTTEEKVVDAGPLEINKKEDKTIGWPVYAGGIAVAAGVIILIAARKKA